MSPDVVQLLDRQGGIARRRDLLKAGLGRRQLVRCVERGELRALTPHLFSNVPRPGPDEELRAAAIGLRAVVSHSDAALLWGIELAETPELRTLTVGRDRSRATRPGVRVRRRDVEPADWILRCGVRVTTELRTLLDLCRDFPLAHAVVAVDSALRQGLVTLVQLQHALLALSAGPGRAQVARVLALADARCGSVLESLTRVLLAQHGLPRPQTQLLVRTRSGSKIGRVDFAWEDARVVVETDGFAFHADRRSYRDDRRRSNALVRAGWQVLRFSWEDVVAYPEYVVECVREVLAERVAA